MIRWEPPVTRHDRTNMVGKSPLIPGRPDVTMRLETPVIYFHPPQNWQHIAFDLEVQFRGGVLNEFYPSMLETWRESWFGMRGLRVLYIVPTEWVSYHLPLTISTPHEFARLFVGRIDLRD